MASTVRCERAESEEATYMMASDANCGRLQQPAAAFLAWLGVPRALQDWALPCT